MLSISNMSCGTASESLRRAFLRIDEIRDLEIQRKVGFEILGVAGIYCSGSM
jgi:hypothetical protein